MSRPGVFVPRVDEAPGPGDPRWCLEWAVERGDGQWWERWAMSLVIIVISVTVFVSEATVLATRAVSGA